MPKIFNDDGTFREVEHINFYLLPGPDIFVKPRSIPLSAAVPNMIAGNKPVDGGNLILSVEERNKILKKYPQAEKFFKICIGGREFLHNEERYCLWLVDASPDEIKRIPPIYERVKKVREYRLNSKDIGAKSISDRPATFRDTRNPESFIAIPQVSSERRKYIPIGFLDKNIIATNQILTIPNAEIWQFGILQSSVHMIWTKAVCGRLESRIRYSAKIVYNNFPWVKMEFIDYAQLIMAAQKILKVRKNYSDASLADLYDEVTMPKELRDAHKNLDRIVLRIYHYDEDMTEEEIAINLLERYKFLTDYLAANKMKQLGERNSDDDEYFEEGDH